MQGLKTSSFLWTDSMLAQMTSVWQRPCFGVCTQHQGLMEVKTFFRSLQTLPSPWSLQRNDLCMCEEWGHNPLLVPGRERNNRGMQWAGSDEIQMDNFFARKDHMLRQGDTAENKVGGQLEQTDHLHTASEALDCKEWSWRSAKNSLLWNLGEGVGVNNGWSFNNVEIISTHDLALCLSHPPPSPEDMGWDCGLVGGNSPVSLHCDCVLRDPIPLEGD